MSNEQLEQLLNYISLPIYLLSIDRSLVYANVAGHEHLNKTQFVQMICGRFQICGEKARVLKFEKGLQAAAETSSGVVEI